ncbi:MAG TPA: hypothetical protein VMF60_06040, partial [Acidimicrobiales bacterium]|nr:hypothetical protein [Acidimicrobiales bacterium]
VWDSAVAPLPADAASNPEAAVTAVTCVAVGSCVAVGGYLAKKAQGSGLIEVLSGGTWTPRRELPAGFSGVEFSAVSCPATGSCVAVGEGSSASGGSSGVMANLSDGTWSMTAAPLPANVAAVDAFGLFGSVTCPVVGACEAVGADLVLGAKKAKEEGFIDTLSAGQWTATEAPLASKKSAHALSDLQSVACPAADACAAGGVFADKSHKGGEGLLETLSSGTWSPVDVPLPANAVPGASGPFSDVTCPAVGTCVAVADYVDASGNQQALIETLTGATWTATQAPVPADAGTDPFAALGGVSCPSAGSCVAVGGYTDTSGDEQGLVETLADGAWTATEAPLPADAPAIGGDPSAIATTTAAAARLARSSTVRLARATTRTTAGSITETKKFSWARQVTGTGALTTARRTSKATAFTDVVPPVLSTLSCATTHSCVAAGSLYYATGPVGVIDTLSAGTWTTSEALPADAARNTLAQLDAVACGAPTSCLAVGSYDDTSGDAQGLVSTQNGTTWSPSEVPAPAGAAADPEIDLEGIACAPAGSCVAVGSYLDADGDLRGLVETLDGGSWTASGVPLPTGTTDPNANLSSVACPELATCVAVGSVFDATGGTGQGLVETLSGGTWTPSVPPVPGKTSAHPVSVLSAVTCPAVGSCQAVGAYAAGKKGPIGLLETLTDGRWIPTSVPPPGSGSTGWDLVGVSCAGVGTCVAVGTYLDSGGFHGLIDTLSDGTWTQTEAPSPSKADSLVTLSSVSCPPSAECVAVGSYLRESRGTDQPTTGNFFDALHGKKWTSAKAPSPPDAFLFDLVSVSCATANSCASVGNEETTTGGEGGVIETT